MIDFRTDQLCSSAASQLCSCDTNSEEKCPVFGGEGVPVTKRMGAFLQHGSQSQSKHKAWN